MSKCSGYTNYFKLLSDNSVKLQIDLARLWKRSNENFTQLDVSNCSLTVINRDGSVRIGGLEVEVRATQKDLGLVVHTSLTWTSRAEFCCQNCHFI